MYTTSTHRFKWMFTSEDELNNLRLETNKKYNERNDDSLTPLEEQQLLRSYFVYLKDFFRKFQPPARKSVVSIALYYMKRFYLHESCIKYHPRAIGITCAYLACKVDEFNVTISQFTKNVKGDGDRAAQIVLQYEMLVIEKLKFHLIVHLPYRPVQGFLSDLRARGLETKNSTDLMEQHIDDFLEKCLFTDACFLYAPSQIALISVFYGARQCGIDLEPYLRDVIFVNNPEKLDYLRHSSAHIKQMLDTDSAEQASKDVIKRIEKKLSLQCPSNSPE